MCVRALHTIPLMSMFLGFLTLALNLGNKFTYNRIAKGLNTVETFEQE